MVRCIRIMSPWHRRIARNLWGHKFSRQLNPECFWSSMHIVFKLCVGRQKLRSSSSVFTFRRMDACWTCWINYYFISINTKTFYCQCQSAFVHIKYGSHSSLREERLSSTQPRGNHDRNPRMEARYREDGRCRAADVLPRQPGWRGNELISAYLYYQTHTNIHSFPAS